MFEQSFTGQKEFARKSTLVFSLMIQSSIVCLLILAQIVYTQGLPSAQLRALLVAPQPPTSAPKAQQKAEVQRRVSTQTFRELTAPTSVPHVIPKTIQNDFAEAAPSIPGVDSPGIQGSGEGPVVPEIINSVGKPIPPLQPLPEKPSNGPLHISNGVAQANLIYRVQPVYPLLARSARVQGVVEFSATISKEGGIENLMLLRGHPLLVNAARDAILQWRYRPTLLNGAPVEVVTDILVNFTLN